MTDQAQARPGHEHVAAVRQRLAQQRWRWIEWWQATDTDDEGLHRRRGASNPASVIADVLEAAAELGLLAGHAIPTVASATRIVLERITQAAEAYLTRSAEAVAGRGRAELRRHLADATTDAWMLLRPNSAGVGSDQDAPSAPQVRPQAAEQADPVAQYPPERLRASEAVPDTVPTLLPGDLDTVPPIVRMAARDAANAGANAGLGTTIEEAIDAAITATWAGAHQHLAGHYRLAAERAAGIEEGRLDVPKLAGARLIVADGAQPTTTTTITAADLERGAQADTTWPGPDLAEVGKWAQDFTTDEDGAPGSVSELDEHVWEEWGRTVGARTDRDRYRQLTILAAWVVATMRELRLREEKPAAREADAPSEIGPSEPTSNSDPGSVGASPALDRALALLHDVLDDHWLDLPGRPAGQPGAMRFLDGGQLAGWRQRMAAIEEAVDPNYEGPHRSRNFPVEYADDAYQADPATLQRSQEAISAVLDLCATADEHRSEAGPYAALYEWAPKVRAEIATHLGKTPAAMPLPAATRVALAQLVAAVEHHLTTDADDTLSAGYRRGARDGLDCRIREARQALGRGAH